MWSLFVIKILLISEFLNLWSGFVVFFYRKFVILKIVFFIYVYIIYIDIK